MGKIYYVFGKSSTGKDTIYRRLLENEELKLNRVVSYTTRPIRDGEVDGVEYHFVDEEGFQKLKEDGRIIEDRVYHTVHGPWRYFTVNDEELDLANRDYLIIGVLKSYESIRDYFGEDKVVPIYIEVDDGVRLQRALDREKRPENQKYAEMCRRYLADHEDFSEDKLEAAGIKKRFINDELEQCIAEIEDYIRKEKKR